MSTTSNKASASQISNTQSILNDKAVKVLADAIFKQLKEEGCQAKDIICVSSQLLGLVSEQIKEKRSTHS
jgi:hypothetical protein